ncbi:hypothetical protein R1flu_016675 [Riccia fluitans]|uniref:Uncharacterized protein n=1 Tax=Riccia fluitans TaxID=41844 RepID=A0ABD1YQM3_9MARC
MFDYQWATSDLHQAKSCDLCHHCINLKVFRKLTVAQRGALSLVTLFIAYAASRYVLRCFFSLHQAVHFLECLDSPLPPIGRALVIESTFNFHACVFHKDDQWRGLGSVSEKCLVSILPNVVGNAV